MAFGMREGPLAGADSQLKLGGGKTCSRFSKGNPVFLVQITAQLLSAPV